MSGRVGPLAGIVLAAGGSRRMGRPKQLLALAGRPLLQHVLDAAAASALAEIVLVLGHEASAVAAALDLPARARVVVNDAWAAGQGTSLACGVRAVAAGEGIAAAVLLGDQPGVDAALVDAMIAAFRATDAAAVRPVWRDADGAARPGHPVVLGRELFAEAATLAGDQGARVLFARAPERLREIALAGAPPPDVDEPEDYRRVTDAAQMTQTGGL
ncbi:MAG: nucleotidyltransferase family protein [Deltaproteobacteria bacterium]|nr:nucleotidyltransferase family protein [Deltaproteobacteria bacterium]